MSRFFVFSTAVGLAASLVACSSGSSTPTTPTTTTPTTTTTPAAARTTSASMSTAGSARSSSGASSGSATSAATDAGVGTAGMTAPGTVLKLGEKATLNLKIGNKTGVISISATKITQGDPADLAPLKLGDRAAGMTPYYVTFEVTGGPQSDNFRFAGFPSAHGRLGDGSTAQSVYIFGAFAPCSEQSFPKDFGPGQVFTSCTVALTSGNAAVVGADLQPVASDYGTAKTAIVWK